MNKLSSDDRVRVIAALVEGNSIRSTVRMTGIAKNTVAKLLVEIGEVCAEFHDKNVRNVKAKRVQCDEIWSFVGMKQKNVPAAKLGLFGFGDVWTWIAIESETKLVISYMVGTRDGGSAAEFMHDVAGRIVNRIQLTTDGHKAYLDAVENAFGGDIDYAMLIKVYGAVRAGEARYSPAQVIGCQTNAISGSPEHKHVSTSHVERQNLTMRMGMRRFTRLTNGFSKKVENHEAAIALHYMYYNYCRIHQTLRVTPAMAAGLTDHVWELEDIAAMVEERELVAIENGAMKRGSYKKKNSN